MIAIILTTLFLQKIPKGEIKDMLYTSQVEDFCHEYDLAADFMEHPNSILTADGSRAFISDLEIEAICKVVMSEARGESCEGQEAVATVILNRWQEGSFGSTITEVLTADGQFAEPYEGDISMSVRLAVNNAIIYYNTYCQDLPSQCLYFRADHYHAFGKPYISIGNLYFSTRSDVVL